MRSPNRLRRGVSTPQAVLVIAVAIAGALVVYVVAGVGRGTERPTVEPVSGGISGYLFQDRNGNGGQDEGEPALAGERFEVFGTGPLAVGSGRSAKDGSFTLGELAVHGETLRVRVVPVLEGPASLEIPEATRLGAFRSIAIGRPAAIAVPSLRTCPEPVRCPGMALPDLLPLTDIEDSEEYSSPKDWTIDDTSEPGRRLLRISSATENRGGLMHLVAAAPEGETRGVVQLVYGQGYVYSREVGSFVFHPEHKHFHVADYLQMRLVDPSSGATVARSEKLSFCLTDVLTIQQSEQELVLDLPPFDCGLSEQGINPGRADYYGQELPDQYIDVTGVPAGDYEIEFEVDPSERFLDADRENNLARLPVTLPAP